MGFISDIHRHFVDSIVQFNHTTYSVQLLSCIPCLFVQFFVLNNIVYEAQNILHIAEFASRKEINRCSILQFAFLPPALPCLCSFGLSSLYQDEILSVFSIVIRRQAGSRASLDRLQLRRVTDEGTQSDSAVFYCRLNRQRPSFRFDIGLLDLSRSSYGCCCCCQIDLRGRQRTQTPLPNKDGYRYDGPVQSCLSLKITSRSFFLYTTPHVVKHISCVIIELYSLFISRRACYESTIIIITIQSVDTRWRNYFLIFQLNANICLSTFLKYLNVILSSLLDWFLFLYHELFMDFDVLLSTFKQILGIVVWSTFQSIVKRNAVMKNVVQLEDRKLHKYLISCRNFLCHKFRFGLDISLHIIMHNVRCVSQRTNARLFATLCKCGPVFEICRIIALLKG